MTDLPVSAELGVVVIGRNEGERLVRCLDSLHALAAMLVYVDSGSTDGSIEQARSRGAEVVELDMQRPFTAARARNAGLDRLRQVLPGVRLVQFVDGDCEVLPGWLAAGQQFLAQHPKAAAAFGRQRERHPLRSIYNQLCEYEWRVPAGPARSFAGNVLVRDEALRQAGGYRNDLIAGEEPELCVRLRALGWTIHSLDAHMSVHDANILGFGQWWKRTKRAGYAFAQGAHLHGHPPERHWVRESRRAWAWGVVLPLAILAAALVFGPLALLLLAIYPLQMLRLAIMLPGPPRERWIKAGLYTIARFAEAQGQLLFLRDRCLRRERRLIEYK
jgi:glycosyltransferase involved in cell wall biosynthesis